MKRSFAAAAVVLLAGASALAPIGGSPAFGSESAELSELRGKALDLVNAARQQHGLRSLELGDQLNTAAQAHSEDMLRRDYFAHESPSGETVQDRFIEAGGSRWRVVAENIAHCSPCAPDEERVKRFQQGWMESPGHRQNILRQGLNRFGFGIASGGSKVYAVQTFAGPGVSLGREPGDDESALSAEQQSLRALQLINRARERAGLAPLKASGALDQAARSLLPDPQAEEFTLGAAGSLGAALPPGERGRWRSVASVAAACGGCGTKPTAGDVRHFGRQWLDHPQFREQLLGRAFTHLGFAIQTDGEGKKIAVALLGQSA